MAPWPPCSYAYEYLPMAAATFINSSGDRFLVIKLCGSHAEFNGKKTSCVVLLTNMETAPNQELLPTPMILPSLVKGYATVLYVNAAAIVY